MWPGVSNITSNPLFVDPSNGDYRLQSNSPCIDTGIDLVGITNDLQGFLRPLDGNGMAGAQWDMGAYELPGPALLCDFDADVYAGAAPLDVVFTATVVGTNTTGLFYRWDFENSGTPDIEGSTFGVVTNTYTNSGLYSVWLTVTNAAGDTNTMVKADFIAIAGPPTVNNDGGASNVTESSAELNGLLTAGGLADTYIFWGTYDGATNKALWATNAFLGTRSNGLFSVQVNGLDPGRTHYYRCYVTNAWGEDWADSTATFVTLSSYGDFAYRMKITCKGYGKSETLTNFPLLVVFKTNMISHISI